MGRVVGYVNVPVVAWGRVTIELLQLAPDPQLVLLCLTLLLNRINCCIELLMESLFFFWSVKRESIN